MSKNPFGKQGDFITSPNISIFFSEMLSIWILSIWEKLKKPKKINIIDLGGGNGEMSYNILQTLDNFPRFKNFFNIYIHEKSPLLKKKQKIRMKDKKVFWIDDLRNIKKGPCLFLANEFFDALPIKQYLKTNKIWKERKVKHINPVCYPPRINQVILICLFYYFCFPFNFHFNISAQLIIIC